MSDAFVCVSFFGCGVFRSDYSNATDLHIAVTTSAGDIVEFDRYGLRRHRREDNPRDWWQSLLVGDLPEPWYDYWDEVLEQVSTLFLIPHRNDNRNCNTNSFICFFVRFADSHRDGRLPATRRAVTIATHLFWPSCRLWAMPSSAMRPAQRPASVRSILCLAPPPPANISPCIVDSVGRASMCIASSPSNPNNVPSKRISAMA